MSIIRKVTPQERAALDPKQFSFKVRVELGPGITKGKSSFTNQEMIEVLEETARCREKSASATLFAHLAEHIKFAAEKAENRQTFLRQRADHPFDCVYYGCDSCGEGGCVCNDDCEECC